MTHFLAEWAVRSAVLILGAALLLWALRVKDASIRLAAWTAMLGGSFVIPVLTVVLPAIPLRAVRVTVPAAMYEAAPETVVFDEVPERSVAVSKHFDWTLVVVTVYALVAGALLLRLFVGLAMSLRMLRRCGATEHIGVRESEFLGSPVTIGIVRPAIVLPVDWREWDAAKLDAVLAHERSHIRRYDPAVQLVSAIHRALLWHSPLSWFLHQRLVRVAEEASDDAAASTCDRALYAEVLVEFMQRGVRGFEGVPMARYGSPVARVHRILDATVLSRGVTRWSVAAILVLGLPLAYLVAAGRAQESAAGHEKRLVFEVASVKPAIVPAGVTVNGTAMTSSKRGDFQRLRNTGGPGTDDPGRIHYPLISLKGLLLRAYDSYFEITGPGWLDSDVVAVDATMPPETTKAQFKEMLRNLIADRFKLTFHTETKEIAGYVLTVARGGLKMKESADQSDAAPKPMEGPRHKGPDGFIIVPPDSGPLFMIQGEFGNRERMVARQRTVQELARSLSSELASKVTDATGLTAKYDFTVTYAGHLGRGGSIPSLDMAEASDPNGLPDIFSALQSQVGLKLERKKVAVEVFVVDHMDKVPGEN